LITLQAVEFCESDPFMSLEIPSSYHGKWKVSQRSHCGVNVSSLLMHTCIIPPSRQIKVHPSDKVAFIKDEKCVTVNFDIME
jgi:hypothetical protein